VPCSDADAIASAASTGGSVRAPRLTPQPPRLLIVAMPS